MFDQTALLQYVEEVVEETYPETDKIAIRNCIQELQFVVDKYGENGNMALAILGLRGAARAEKETEHGVQ